MIYIEMCKFTTEEFWDINIPGIIVHYQNAFLIKKWIKPWDHGALSRVWYL